MSTRPTATSTASSAPQSASSPSTASWSPPRADAADFASADDLLDHYDEAAATGSRPRRRKGPGSSRPLARREKDFACLRDKIDDAAGFTPVHHALQTFAANAPKIQIAQALDSLLVGLSNLSGYHREKAELNLQGAEDPDELRAELERRQEEIDSLKNAVQKSEEVDHNGVPRRRRRVGRPRYRSQKKLLAGPP